MSPVRSLLPLALAALLAAGCGAPAAMQAPVAARGAVEALRAYPIEEVFGIGPVYGKKLREVGVSNTQQLLAATRTRYQRQKLAEAADVPYPHVLSWSRRVQVMQIPGIGVRQGNLLAAVGVASVRDLARRNPAELHERMALANAFEPHFTQRLPSVDTIHAWVEAAQKMPADLADDESDDKK